MINETKLKILKTILNAGPKGADREMLDNLKAVIKDMEGENYGLPSIESRAGNAQTKLTEVVVQEKRAEVLIKKKPGRPFKKR